MSKDERAIRELIERWLLASTLGDAATILGLMADDVVFLVPGRAPFGKDEFAASQRALEHAKLDAESRVRELRVLGDWAFGWTELSVTLTPDDGGAPTRRSGHTMSMFQRLRDGRWVLARDANLLAPAARGANPA